MNKKNVLLVLFGYLIWGFQPLFWALLDGFDSMFVLACRVVWGAVFCLAVLALRGDLGKLWALFRDKRTMRYLLPASVFLLLDWGLFIWAVQSGHVLDTSLGYFMGPLAVFSLSLFLFHERCSKWQLVAIGCAVAGVLFSVFQYSRFPLLAIVLAFVFTIYGAFKKYAQVDPLLSIAAETLLMAPLALLFILFFGRGVGGMASIDLPGQLLLIASGAVTAVPMILYSIGVIHLPFYMLGFFQYVSPTISMLCGLLMGETLSPDRLVTFLFIWAGLIIFSASTLRTQRNTDPQP